MNRVRHPLFWLATFLLFLACENADRTAADGNTGSTDTDGDTETASGTADDTGTGGPDGGDTASGSDTSDGSGCTSMDILFVIDDSGSMTEEQANLAANFPAFVAVLDNYVTPGGTSLLYRLGVTTTGVTRNFKEKTPIPGFPGIPTSTSGPDGELLGQEECGLGAHPWLESTEADVTTKFSCMATRGTSGSATEMPLAAIESAIGEQMADGGPNAGFYRKDEGSLLVIVVISDEDDCSIDNGGTMAVQTTGDGSDCNETTSVGLYEPAEMRDFVLDVVGGEGRVVVVGIAGATPGGCDSSFGSAIYAKHIKTFVEGFGDHGLFGNICAGDLSTTLAAALEIMEISCETLPPLE